MPDDGGPAFPYHQPERPYTHLGMSLRDWFAGQALAGIAGAAFDVLNRELVDGVRTQENAGKLMLDLPSRCYEVADAMLAARGRVEKPDA